MNAASLAPGTLFAGDFEIVRLLSTGGMGSVYVARQKSTGKVRALKLMLLQLVQDADLRRRFDQEARIASLIKSDHVVEVVGAGVDEATGVPWLAMELLEGTDLDTAVTQRGAMTAAEARRVLEQVCHAVAAAHAAGIIHRDLKPENVFLAQTKQAKGGQMVKVLDFGIAKIAVEASTKHTGAMGSPMWMAPEQTERNQVTPATDVWALGLIAFFLLTGKPFWLAANRHDTSVQQILREVIIEPIPRASERAKELGTGDRLPEWFDAFFERCVVRAPNARLRNAHEAFTTFARYYDDPSAATPASGGDILSAPVVVNVNGATPQTSSPPPNIAGTMPTAPTMIALPHVPERPAARARPLYVFLLALMTVSGAGVVYELRPWKTAPAPASTEAPKPAAPEPAPSSAPAPIASDVVLSPELARTDGAKWYERVRARCNRVEIDSLLEQDPPPQGKDGAGFAAVCLMLAGNREAARARITALPPADRAWAVRPAFEIIEPIADSGDDKAAGPAMVLVADFWPENHMALYHAAMHEYRIGRPRRAHEHLEKFVEGYDQQDGFMSTARKLLAELEQPSGAVDCHTPLTIDPEGRRVFRYECLHPDAAVPLVPQRERGSPRR
jgi:serine/threonine protein kinase